MCGIAGIVYFDPSRSVDEDILKRMTDAIRHRGPDAQGFYTAGSIGLGSCRLRIIDLSTGDMPLSNEDCSVWIVHNGEVYNFQELRVDLEARGHQFQTSTDTEVILHLYEELGEQCADKLRGMFAFAIWDARERQLLLARDRVGQKPLFYYVTDEMLLFASEIKALLEHPAVPREMDQVSLVEFLRYGYVPAPRTMFEGIQKLPPAHTLLLHEGRITTRRYWTLRYHANHGLSEAEASEMLLTLLREAVRIRMVSDVPLGALLSGGIDSSAVVALMSEYSDQSVKTYTIGFDERGFDERPYARLVAQHFGTEHHELIVQPEDVRDVLPKLVWQFDEPFADSSALPTYYVCKLARQHVTVALGGDGGDEAFAGYGRYAEALRWSRFDAVPARPRRILGKLAYHIIPRGRRGKRLAYLQRLTPDERYDYMMQQFHPWSTSLESVLVPEMAQHLAAEPRRVVLDALRQAHSSNYLSRLQYADVMTYLPEDILVKVDWASMLNSLEVLAPLLDHKIQEFAAALPTNLRLKAVTSKYILKKTLNGILPSNVLSRPKQGFAIPTKQWFLGDAGQFARDILLDPKAGIRDFIRKDSLKNIVSSNGSGRRSIGPLLWTMLVLELWHRTYLTRSL